MATSTLPLKTKTSTQTRVIVLDDIAEKGLALLEAATGIEYDIRIGLKGDELREALQQYDGAVCRSGVKITADALEGNRRLRAIVRAGVGTDNIDKAAATRRGIIVMNTPDGNTLSTAEHTMTLLLGLSRHVAPADASLKSGKWDRKSFQGSQLAGKKLGVVGLGRIGIEVAKRAKAFGMDVLGFDPFMSVERAAELGITKVESVDELWPVIDYLTVHTPLTPETTGLVGATQIAKMKTGVRLINCARGGIYDEQALIDGLKSGKLAGVALDVYAEEPCTTSPLFQLPHTLCTPHLGASTDEAQVEVAVEAVELLVNYLKTGANRSAVNALSLDPQTLKQLRGYLDVAYRLGIFMSQWHGGSIESCELNVEGEISAKDTRLMLSAFCVGLIGDKIEGANIVNAEVLCHERGIELIHKTTQEHGTFSSVISARVAGEGRVLEASATLFGKNMPRLIKLGRYLTDAHMDGILLIFTHMDMPGVIGCVGKELADSKVNIAHMAVAREGAPGGPAVGVLNLDNAADEDAVDRIRKHGGIEFAKQIFLPRLGEYPDWLA